MLLAPQVFDQDDDGIVVLLKDNPGDDEQAAVGESIRVCPASAIRMAG